MRVRVHQIYIGIRTERLYDQRGTFLFCSLLCARNLSNRHITPVRRGHLHRETRDIPIHQGDFGASNPRGLSLSSFLFPPSTLKVRLVFSFQCTFDEVPLLNQLQSGCNVSRLFLLDKHRTRAPIFIARTRTRSITARISRIFQFFCHEMDTQSTIAARIVTISARCHSVRTNSCVI